MKNPRGQKWVRIFNGSQEYCITSNSDRSRYTIYEVDRAGDEAEYTELGSGSNPSELEKRFVWE